MFYSRNRAAYYLIQYFSGVAFILPIWVIFNREFLELSNTAAFILGTIQYWLIFLFEIPTGAWADKYGRLLVFRIGALLQLAGVASFVITKDFAILLLYQVIGAFGAATSSGTLRPIIYQELPKNKQTIESNDFIGRSEAIVFLSRATTVVVGGLLYTINPVYPFIGMALGHLTSFLISFAMTDKSDKSPLPTKLHIYETLAVLKKSYEIKLLAIMVLFFVITSETIFALFQPYLRYINFDLELFGVIYLVVSVFSGLGAIISRKINEKKWLLPLLLMQASIVITSASMLTESILLFILGIIPASVAFGVVRPIYDSVLLRKTVSDSHSTALSIGSFYITALYGLVVVSVGVLLDNFTVLNVVSGILALSIVFSAISIIINIKKKDF